MTDNQTPERYVRSSDRPNADTWQFPPKVPRMEAMTAYDDETLTYVIGDDLTILGAATLDRPTEVDTLVRYLGALRRAGVVGEWHLHPEWNGYSSYTQLWTLVPVDRTSAGLHFIINRDDELGSISASGSGHRFVGYVKRNYTDSSESFSSQLAECVEQAAHVTSLTQGWNAATRALPGSWRSWSIVEVAQTGELVVTTGLRNNPDRRVTITFANQEVVSVVATGFKGSETFAGDDHVFALASLIGITGGRRGKVNIPMWELLNRLARTSDHPITASVLKHRCSVDLGTSTPSLQS